MQKVRERGVAGDVDVGEREVVAEEEMTHSLGTHSPS
jgi:hypothetical protein